MTSRIFTSAHSHRSSSPYIRTMSASYRDQGWTPRWTRRAAIKFYKGKFIGGHCWVRNSGFHDDKWEDHIIFIWRGLIRSGCPLTVHSTHKSSCSVLVSSCCTYCGCVRVTPPSLRPISFNNQPYSTIDVNLYSIEGGAIGEWGVGRGGRGSVDFLSAS